MNSECSRAVYNPLNHSSILLVVCDHSSAVSMQSDEDKKNLFDVSLTDNIKISFEQSSCPYENYACKIRDELLKQIEEDIRRIDEIKDEPCHSTEEVCDDKDARVEGGVSSITVADTGSGSENGVKDHKQIYDEWRLSLENVKQENIDSSSQDYLTQTMEDIKDILTEDIKEEPRHPDHVSGGSDTRVGDDVPSVTAADTRHKLVRLVERAEAGAICRKRGVAATSTTPLVARAADGASCRTNEEDHPATKMARTASTSRSGGAPQQPSTVRSMDPKNPVPKMRKPPQKQSDVIPETAVAPSRPSRPSRPTPGPSRPALEPENLPVRPFRSELKLKPQLECVEGYGVNVTPGGSLRLSGERRENRPSPRGSSLRRHDGTRVPTSASEKVGTLAMFDDEGEPVTAADPKNIQQWLDNIVDADPYWQAEMAVAAAAATAQQEEEAAIAVAGVSGLRECSAHSSLLPSALATKANVSSSMDIASVQAPTVPSASNIQADVPAASSVADNVRPSTSGLAAMLESVLREEMNEGSDLDSDFEDEFTRITQQVVYERNIPDDEEIEEPIRETIHALEREMDEEVESLAGESSSYKWVEGFDTFRGRRHEFTGPAPGPVRDYDIPYDAFTDIWGKDIVERIVLETNRYAKQTIDKYTARGQLPIHSRLRKWTDTDVDEIYRLFAVYIYMGICQRSSKDEYWKTNNVLNMPDFRSVMSFDRYVLMSKFLHFVDNMDTSPSLRQIDGFMLSKKVSKLAPVIIHLNSKFSSLYNLSVDISIDESLTLFKGRLSWVQCIRTQAARFGIKSYELCESKSGYLHNFIIYSGKNSESQDTAAVSSDLTGKNTQVVLDLLKGLEQRGHHLTMDNFYNSPALSRYLKSKGFDSLGTLRPTRKNVPSVIAKVPKNVAKGTIVARHCGDLSIIAWKDSKVVTMISTYHTDETYVGSKAGKVLVKPVCVKDYNRTMGGVDVMDQKLSMYLVERKRGVKWYMKMFKRLLNISIHNAYVMYNASMDRRSRPIMKHRAFRYALAESLITKHSHMPLVEFSQSIDVSRRLNRNIVHVPNMVHGTNNRKRCVICLRKGKDKKVSYCCVECDTFMCLDDCWREWHTLKDLKGQERRSRPRTRT